MPLLEEIRDFANKTKTYPLGPVQFEKYNEQEPSPFRGVPFRDPEHIFVCGLNDEIRFTQTVPQLVKEATIRISSYGGMYASDNGRILEVKYGFEGIEYDHSYIDEGFSTQCRLPRSTPVTICYGVRLRMAIAGTQIGDIELCQQREEEVTRRVNAEEAREARARGLTIEPHILLREEWVPFPAKPGEQKAMLAEAFHNPAYLGTTDKFAQPVEPQTNTGISGIVKGFLGLK